MAVLTCFRMCLDLLSPRWGSWFVSGAQRTPSFGIALCLVSCPHRSLARPTQRQKDIVQCRAHTSALSLARSTPSSRDCSMSSPHQERERERERESEEKKKKERRPPSTAKGRIELSSSAFANISGLLYVVPTPEPSSAYTETEKYC